MKRRLKIFAGLLLTLLLAAGCAPDYQAQYQKTVDSYYGTVNKDHYSNAWLKAELDLPAQWHVREDPMKAVVVSAGEKLQDQQALEAAVKNVEGIAVYNLLQLFKNPLENQKEFNPSLVMMVERTAGKGITDAEAYLEASRQVMSQRQMPMGFKQKLEAPIDKADIGGLEFAHLPIDIETSLFTIHQDYYAYGLPDDRMMGIMVSWRGEAEKTEMMNALSGLKIEE